MKETTFQKGPSLMEKTNAMEALKYNANGADATELYKKLGSPPNACFWWNDMHLAAIPSDEKFS